MVLIADRCVPPPLLFTSPNMYFTTSRTNVTTISPSHWPSRRGGCTCLHLRQEINILKQTYLSFIVNNRWKRVQFTKRIYLNIGDRQHETIAPYLHFFGISIVLALLGQGITNAHFLTLSCFIGLTCRNKAVSRNVSWEDELGSDGPICAYFFLLQIVLFFRKSAINIIGTFCVIILKCLKLRYFLYFYNCGTTSSSNKRHVHL